MGVFNEIYEYFLSPEQTWGVRMKSYNALVIRPSAASLVSWEASKQQEKITRIYRIRPTPRAKATFGL